MLRIPSNLFRRGTVALTFLAFMATGFAVTWRVQALRAEPWPQTAQAGSSARVFGADAGMIVNTIKADRTADFEMVIGKVKEALQRSENPQRKAQAASWRIFRSVEPGPNGSALYVFWIDPPARDADYTVARILAEAFPNDVQALYKTFNDCYSGGQSLLNLRLVSSLGQ
jgi:hypothetical protein